MADPYISNVVLLLLGNGAEGSTTFTDSSPLASTVTRIGSPTVSTASPPVGTGFLSFAEATLDGLSVPSNSGFDFGYVAPFTVEFYINIGGSGSAVVLDYYDETTSKGWGVSVSSGGDVSFYTDTSSVSCGAGNLRGAGWKHIAFQLDTAGGNMLEAYVNGTRTNLVAANAPAISTNASGAALYVGMTPDLATSGFTGGLDCVRLTKGVRRYTSTFTPPGATDFGDTSITSNSGTAALFSPLPALVASGAARIAIAALISPTPSLVAVGHDAAGEQSATLVSPSTTLAAFAGGMSQLTAPSPALQAVATFTGIGQATLVAPSPLFSAAGTVSATASASLAAPAAKLAGYFGAVASVSISGVATLTATGSAGSAGYATITAPLFELTAAATRGGSGSAVLTAPIGRLATTGAAWLVAPGAQLTAIGTAVVAVSYEAYALNLNHRNPDSPDELTRYTNYPFDRIVRYENSYFGMNATGLYLLEGTTDFAEPTPTKVPWSYKTALMDMKSVQLKNVSMAYFGGRMGPAAAISVYVGEASTSSYAYTTPRDATVQNYRQPLGKGLKSRYYAFGASGTGELTLDTLSLDVAVLARKV